MCCLLGADSRFSISLGNTPVRLGLSGGNFGKISERPRKRSQSFSWNSPREYGWDPPSPTIEDFGALGPKDLLHAFLTTLGTFEVSGPCSKHSGSKCLVAIHVCSLDVVFLLTVGSFLLTVELFYLQLRILASLLTIRAFCLQL